MLSGWFAAFLFFVLFVASLAANSTERSSSTNTLTSQQISSASTCEEVLVLALLAYETGDVVEFVELSERSQELGCQ